MSPAHISGGAFDLPRDIGEAPLHWFGPRNGKAPPKQTEGDLSRGGSRWDYVWSRESNKSRVFTLAYDSFSAPVRPEDVPPRTYSREDLVVAGAVKVCGLLFTLLLMLKRK
jgi:hypothetical protein